MPIQSLFLSARILSLRQTIIASGGRYGGASQRADKAPKEKMLWLRESFFAACCPFLLQIIIFRGGRSFDFTPPLITARDTSIFVQRSNFTLSLSLHALIVSFSAFLCAGPRSQRRISVLCLRRTFPINLKGKRDLGQLDPLLYVPAAGAFGAAAWRADKKRF